MSDRITQWLIAGTILNSIGVAAVASALIVMAARS